MESEVGVGGFERTLIRPWYSQTFVAMPMCKINALVNFGFFHIADLSPALDFTLKEKGPALVRKSIKVVGQWFTVSLSSFMHECKAQ